MNDFAVKRGPERSTQSYRAASGGYGMLECACVLALFLPLLLFALSTWESVRHRLVVNELVSSSLQELRITPYEVESESGVVSSRLRYETFNPILSKRAAKIEKTVQENFGSSGSGYHVVLSVISVEKKFGKRVVASVSRGTLAEQDPFADLELSKLPVLEDSLNAKGDTPTRIVLAVSVSVEPEDKLFSIFGKKNNKDRISYADYLDVRSDRTWR